MYNVGIGSLLANTAHAEVIACEAEEGGFGLGANERIRSASLTLKCGSVLYDRLLEKFLDILADGSSKLVRRDVIGAFDRSLGGGLGFGTIIKGRILGSLKLVVAESKNSSERASNDGHLVLGEGASLVRANGCRIAHGFARSEQSHQVVVFQHTSCSESQSQGYSQGKTLRYCYDDNGDSNDENVQEVLTLLRRTRVAAS